MTLLQEKIVLVTGAGAGIGRAIALAMAENGATVAAADIDASGGPAHRRRVPPATREIRRRGRSRSRPIAAISPASTGWWRALSPSSAGSTSIVNNAGVTRYAYIMDLTEADWDRIHRVNAKGVFFCLQRAAREMIRQHESRRQRRPHHQHGLDQRPRLCRRLERRLRRERRARSSR